MRVSFVVGVSTLALACVAGAQTVTEEQFLAGLGEQAAAVRALGGDLARAEAERIRAGRLANPAIEFWREQPDANPRVTNWTLDWVPPLDGRLGLGKQAADAGLAAARERLAGERASLRRDVRAAFADWSLAAERRRVLETQLERVRGLAEAERHRARLGEQSGLSARRFALSEGEARAALAVAEAAYLKAEAAARAWRTDLAPGTEPAPLAPPEPPSDVDPSAAPELKAAAHEQEQAALAQKRSGRFLSFPTLRFGWQQISDAGLTRSGPIFSAGWTIPLFDRDQAARAEATRRAEIAVARGDLVRAQLSSRVEGGAAAYRVLFEAVVEAGRSSPEADHVVVAATAAYRAGEASVTDLLDSLRAALFVRLTEIELRERALEMHRDLEAALGRPLDGGAF